MKGFNLKNKKILFSVTLLFLFFVNSCVSDSNDGTDIIDNSDQNQSDTIKPGILATIIPSFEPTSTPVPVPTSTPYPTREPNQSATPEPGSKNNTPPPPPPSSPPYPIPDLDPAPEFILELFDQTQFDVLDQNGKPILLVFWAPWCPYCQKEMPVVESLYSEFLDSGVDVLGIAVLSEFDEALNFYNEHEFVIPTGWDEENEIAKKYGVEGVPSFRLIDKAGNLDLQFSGARGESVLRRVMMYASQ